MHAHSGPRGLSKPKSHGECVAGPPGTIYVALAIAKGSTTVEVTAEAPLVQAESGDVSTTISQRQIADVTNPGNELTYTPQTAPGAIMQTDQSGGTGWK